MDVGDNDGDEEERRRGHHSLSRCKGERSRRQLDDGCRRWRYVATLEKFLWATMAAWEGELWWRREGDRLI